MDSQGGKYFTNLLHEDSNFDDLIFMDSQDQMGQNVKQNTQVPTETTQFSPQMGSTTKRSRGRNFTIDEDNLIVSAWLNASLDAVYGNEQKHKTYWSRVYEYFHKHKTFNHERNVNSLMHRWSTIQLGTNKFYGCFAQIESRHQSGINEQDKISQAKLLYQELHKSSFQYDHCWNLLRFQAKWVEDCQKKKLTKKPTLTTIPPSTPDTVNLGYDDGSHDAFVDLERPIGRKAEKERIKKRKSGDYMTLPLAGILTERKEDNKKNSEKKIEIMEKAYVQEEQRLRHEEQRLLLEKERLAIKNEMFKAEQLKEDERIMLMNTSGLSPMLQQYYHRRHLEILEKGK